MSRKREIPLWVEAVMRIFSSSSRVLKSFRRIFTTTVVFPVPEILPGMSSSSHTGGPYDNTWGAPNQRQRTIRRFHRPDLVRVQPVLVKVTLNILIGTIFTGLTTRPTLVFPTIRLLKAQQTRPSLTSLPTASNIALAVASGRVNSTSRENTGYPDSPTLPALYILHCIRSYSGGSGYCSSIFISPFLANTTTASTTCFPPTQPFSGSEAACNLT